jgi:ATP-dependent Zn protease
MPRRNGLSAAGVVAAVLLVFVFGIGLLYAYRSQSPAVTTASYTVALTAIQEGRVRTVSIEDGRATLTFTDGTRQQTAIPDNGQALIQTITERNRADPAHAIDVTMNNGGPDIAGFFVRLIVTLLPILVLIGLVLLAASAFTRSRAPQRYEALSRLADLRDRGVLSEEEFQREKRRLLR